jgi:hypothetical protein
MPEITNHGKLFFREKTQLGSRAFTDTTDLVGDQNTASTLVLIVRKIFRPISGRGTERPVAVDVNPVPMTRQRFFFVGRHDCSAP